MIFGNFARKKINSVKRAFSNLILKGDYATCSAGRKYFSSLLRGLHKIKVFSGRNAIKSYFRTNFCGLLGKT